MEYLLGFIRVYQWVKLAELCLGLCLIVLLLVTKRELPSSLEETQDDIGIFLRLIIASAIYYVLVYLKELLDINRRMLEQLQLMENPIIINRSRGATRED